MADSRTYRVQFWMRSVAFVAILIGRVLGSYLGRSRDTGD